MALSAKLRPLTEKQTEYAITQTFLGWAANRYGKATCLDCGKRMKINDEKVVFCPHCQVNKKVFQSGFAKHCICYHQKICVVKGYQVVRTFALRADYPKANVKPTFSIQEVVQNWIDENGKEVVVARPMKFMSRYLDDFNWQGDMAVRRNVEDWRRRLRYSLLADSFGRGIKLLPKVIRNGYKGTFYGISAADFIIKILSDNNFEYLIKTGQYTFAKEYVNREGSRFKEYKDELNICHRNKYVIKDARLWMDMVRSFKDIGVDTHNPKYICPVDLKQMHDYAVRLVHKKQEKETIKKHRSNALGYEEQYRRTKKAYIGMSFSDGEISISVLNSVMEILQEGTMMHHCVFSAGYYKKENSLILSARNKNGDRLETIEVDLVSYKVVQSRGLLNGVTKYHDRIVKLVEKNMNVIRKTI